MMADSILEDKILYNAKRDRMGIGNPYVASLSFRYYSFGTCTDDPKIRKLFGIIIHNKRSCAHDNDINPKMNKWI